MIRRWFWLFVPLFVCCGEKMFAFETAKAVYVVMCFQPDSIEKWENDHVYLAPERLSVRRNGVFLTDEVSTIPIPTFSIDQEGVYVLCSREELEREAREHKENAREALIDGVAHSTAAGLLLPEAPPLALYEGYKAVQSFKAMSTEYCEALECERRAQEEVEAYEEREERIKDSNYEGW